MWEILSCKPKARQSSMLRMKWEEDIGVHWGSKCFISSPCLKPIPLSLLQVFTIFLSLPGSHRMSAHLLLFSWCWVSNTGELWYWLRHRSSRKIKVSFLCYDGIGWKCRRLQLLLRGRCLENPEKKLVEWSWWVVVPFSCMACSVPLRSGC